MDNNWFLKDTRGNVVGPISRLVAVDLLRSRPGVFQFASTDKENWQQVRAQVIQSLVTQEDPQARLAREQQEAQRAEFELDRFRELAPHDLFGVPKGSPLKDFRRGFLPLAKRYHPGRLPRDVSPALLRANIAVYQYLTEVLADLEKAFGAAPQPVAPAREAPRPSAPRPRVDVLPSWQLAALKLQHKQERLYGQLNVTRETAFVFSTHRLMNLANGAVFFPCIPSLALGTRLSMTFHFEEAARSVSSLGAVAYENAMSSSGPRGFGVQMELRTEEKGFMLRETHRLSAVR
jgi:Tfp pilus assembly protein PilZ